MLSGYVLTQVADAFKLQSHVMFYDTSHNSPMTVLTNLFDAFSETATKMLAYVRCLPAKQQPNSRMVSGELSCLRRRGTPVRDADLQKIPLHGWSRSPTVFSQARRGKPSTQHMHAR